jgi:phosphopantothenoylcysteine decarboxylase/phosphopantothenate--cysteine ligase
MLSGKKIIIGITGSIAAYKVPFIIRLLKKAGAEVQVIMTHAAADFVTPLTLSTLTERPVLIDFFDTKDGTWSSHIDLGLWADIMLIAPVSANTMAKMAHGIADNLLLTTILSARNKVFFAPAMDLDMYKHPSTKENILKLQSYGYKLIKPVSGELASGLKGCGRLEEPEIIVEIIEKYFFSSLSFYGKRIMITAGPTHEAIDPVRFIGNHSSGKMGIEIARAFAKQGAKVDLILGPTNNTIEHASVNVINVTSAVEMYYESMNYYKAADIIVMAAAVADFTPDLIAKNKIKKDSGVDSIKLKSTFDILAHLGEKKKKGQLLVGFALETNNALENAKKKLINKKLDIIVLNSLKDKGAGFGHDTNKVRILTKNGDNFSYDLKSKHDVAIDLLTVIDRFNKN